MKNVNNAYVELIMAILDKAVKDFNNASLHPEKKENENTIREVYGFFSGPRFRFFQELLPDDDALEHIARSVRHMFRTSKGRTRSILINSGMRVSGHNSKDSKTVLRRYIRSIV